MIRYRYAAQLTPPAPFVKVTVRCPTTGNQAPDLPAQIDTGADRTVVPGSVVQSLGLVEDGRSVFQGFAGEEIELPIYLVEMQVHDLPPVFTRVALGEKEAFIILGRDVLNAHRILLDGPQLALEIDRPPSP
jgi:predicted aspartyl protease